MDHRFHASGDEIVRNGDGSLKGGDRRVKVCTKNKFTCCSQRNAQIEFVEPCSLPSRRVNQFPESLGSCEILGGSDRWIIVAAGLEESHEEVRLYVQMSQYLPVPPTLNPARRREFDPGYRTRNPVSLADQRKANILLLRRHPSILPPECR